MRSRISKEVLSCSKNELVTYRCRATSSGQFDTIYAAVAHYFFYETM